MGEVSSVPVHDDSVLRPSLDVEWSRLGDAGVLVNLRTNRILQLNATGMRVWELIGERLTLAEIRARVLLEFDVTEGVAKEEVDRLVGELTREELIDAGDGA